MNPVSELLDAMPDPDAVDEHWRRICREMVERTAVAEYERGLADGYVRAIEEIKDYQHGLVRDVQLERRRWHLCCPRCRIQGHREGCADCQDRTTETFGQPTVGEANATELLTRARESWEPYGLPPPGMVHLAGRAVHNHGCTDACSAYQPGWYTPAEAFGILARLPGDYAEAIAALRILAMTPGRSAA